MHIVVLERNGLSFSNVCLVWFIFRQINDKNDKYQVSGRNIPNVKL